MHTNGPTSSTAASKHTENHRHPCILCQSRKIKCDRTDPCSNCTRAHVECAFAPISTLQKRKKRFPEAELLARIRRYEEHLRKYGADIDAINRDIGTAVTSDSGVDGATKPKGHASCFPKSSREPSLSVKRSLRHVQNNLFVNEEFRDVEDILQGSSEDELLDMANTASPTSLTVDDSDLLFPSQTIHNLSKLHPPTVHIFRLWQIFLDKVNPLIKVVHAPTVQQLVLDASSNLEKIPKGVEALMFSIYALAVTSLDDGECVSLLGDRKATLLPRYRAGAKQALRNAGFLRSSELLVLQAYFLVLLAGLHFSVDAKSLCCLAGIAVRIAQRMGLSSDGTSFGLLPFETEMRRRLWWQIIVFDCRVSEVSGAGPSVLHRGWTTKLPLNINDSDLYPGMQHWPLEHMGTTEMVYVLPRCEAIQRFLHTGCQPAQDMTSQDVETEDFGEHLQQKYFKFCDHSVPLQLLSSTMGTSDVEKLRMCPRQPHVLANNRLSSPEEKERLFGHSLNMLKVHNKMMGFKSLKPFLWSINSNYPFPAHLYLLCSLRSRASDELTGRAWGVLSESYDNRIYYSQQYESTKSVTLMHPTLAHLTIKAWESCNIGPDLYPLTSAPPSFISEMRSLLADRAAQHDTSQSQTPLIRSYHIVSENHNTSDYPNTGLSSGDAAQQSFDQSLMTSIQSSSWNSTSWDLWNDIMAAPEAMQDFDEMLSSEFPQLSAEIQGVD